MHKRKPRTMSLPLCSCCLSFQCDPASMSREFSHKVCERLSKGLCHACGQPKGFCKCKSAEKGHIILVHTHNNKRLRKAKALVADKETAYLTWRGNETLLSTVFGDEVYDGVEYSLRRHRIPEISWGTVTSSLKLAGLKTDALYPGWH